MVSLEQFQTWLKSPLAIRNVIARVSYYDKINNISGVFKLSLLSFKDFLPLMKDGLTYSEQYSLEGTPKLSSGGLKFENYNGIFDFALEYIYKNKSVEILLGDINWNEADYWSILKGTADHLIPEGSHDFTLVLTDQMERLNCPISNVIFNDIGITTPEVKDNIVPLLLGEVCNFAPILVDPVTRKYRYSLLPTNGLIELREDSIPVALESEDTANASFIPKYKVNGELTCSAQGHLIGGTVYSNKIGAICRAIAQEGGRVATRFLDAEIDIASFSNFDTTYGYSIGYYVTSKENCITIIQALANSGGAQVLTSKTGQLKLLTLALGTSKTTIEPKNIKNDITISQIIDPIGTVSLNYCKNWTVQSQIKSAIPEEHKAIWKKEWRNSEQKDQTVINDYNLSKIVEPIDTFLISKTDADNEATRRLNYWKVPRRIYKLTGTASLLWLNLCDTVTLKFPRYGLNNGKDGIIISMNYNWTSFEVTMEILV